MTEGGQATRRQNKYLVRANLIGFHVRAGSTMIVFFLKASFNIAHY